MQKKSVLAITLFFCLCVLSTTSAAACDGQTYIPTSYHFGQIRLSNITDTDTTVRIKIINQDGDVFVAPAPGTNHNSPKITYYNITNHSQDVPGYTLEFTIEAHKSGFIMFNNFTPLTRTAYGVIEWSKPTGSDSVSLLATVYISGTAIVLNDGRPF